MSPAMAGGFLTTAPPGKPSLVALKLSGPFQEVALLAWTDANMPKPRTKRRGTAIGVHKPPFPHHREAGHFISTFPNGGCSLRTVLPT